MRFVKSVMYEIDAPDFETAEEAWLENGPELSESEEPARVLVSSETDLQEAS